MRKVWLAGDDERMGTNWALFWLAVPHRATADFDVVSRWNHAEPDGLAFGFPQQAQFFLAVVSRVH